MTSTLKPCSLACVGGQLEEVGRRLEHAGDVGRHPADRDVDRVLRRRLIGREPAGRARQLRRRSRRAPMSWNAKLSSFSPSLVAAGAFPAFLVKLPLLRPQRAARAYSAVSSLLVCSLVAALRLARAPRAEAAAHARQLALHLAEAMRVALVEMRSARPVDRMSMMTSAPSREVVGVKTLVFSCVSTTRRRRRSARGCSSAGR